MACFQHSYVVAEVLKNKFPDDSQSRRASLEGIQENTYTIIEFKDGEPCLVDIFPRGTNNPGSGQAGRSRKRQSL